MTTDGATETALHALTDLLLYVSAVLAGAYGVLYGRPELLALIPVAYVIVALDPRYGRWRHVW